VLFDGKNEDEWVSAQDHTPAKWIVADGLLIVARAPATLRPGATPNYQLHVEFRIPADITGTGQGRGNSGVFLASTGPGDAGYELQVLDGYNNSTYVNAWWGASTSRRFPRDPARKPGEWQSYDVVWTAPVFNTDGSLKTPRTRRCSTTACWSKPF